MRRGKGRSEWTHLQLAVHQRGSQVAQLHPGARGGQRDLAREAAGPVLHDGQRRADARRSRQGLCSQCA